MKNYLLFIVSGYGNIRFIGRGRFSGDIPKPLEQCLEMSKTQFSWRVKPYVVINIDYEWVMGRPLVCFDDAIAANWDSSVFGFNGSFVAYDNKKTILSPNEWITTITRNYPSEAKLGGIVYYTTLSYPGIDTPIQHKGSTMFELIPTTSPIYYSGSGNNYTQINVECAHNIVGALSFSVQGVGISINGAWPKISIRGMEEESQTAWSGKLICSCTNCFT